MSTHSCHACAR